MGIFVQAEDGIEAARTGSDRWGGQLLVSKAITKSVMASIYLLLEADDLLPILFFDRVPDIDEFLSWLQRPTSAYLGAFFLPRPTLDEPAPRAILGGIGFVWDIGGGRGTVNMAFLTKFQEYGMPAEWTRQMIQHCFDTDGLDLGAIYGCTPAQNRAAVLFSRRMGFRQTEPLPRYGTYHGVPSGCVISYMTREMWEAKRQ